MTLLWDNSTNTYLGSWQVGRARLGHWSAEVLCSDAARGESDGDGFSTGVDAELDIVDLQEPVIVSVSGSWADSGETTWRVDVEWAAESGETISGSVQVSRSDGSHYRTLLLLVESNSSGYAELSVAAMQPDVYAIDVALSDDSGNPSLDFIAGGPDDVLVITPPPQDPSVGFSLTSWDGWNHTWSGTITTDSQLPTTLSLSIDDKEVEAANFDIDGQSWSLTLDMTTWLAGQHLVEIEACDDEGRCSTSNTTIDTSEVLSLKMQASCAAVQPTSNGTIEAIDCSIINEGQWGTSIRARLQSPAPGASCTVEVIIPAGVSQNVTACELLPETIGNVSLSLLLEAMDVRGEWTVIEGPLQFKLEGPPPIEVPDDVVDEPEDDAGKKDAEDSKSAVNEDNTARWVSIITALSLVALGAMYLSRRREKKEELSEAEELWGMEDPSNLPIPIDHDLAVAMFENPDPVPEQRLISKPQWVAEWESLPPGGSYSETADGKWYQDGEGDWWWSQPDGSWSRRS